MTDPRFEQLLVNFFENASLDPAACLDESGSAFHLSQRDVNITVMNHLPTHGGSAMILIELGPVDSKWGDPGPVWQRLLDFNFIGMQGHPRCFSRNPVNGELILQCALPLQETTAETLRAFMEEGVSLALYWRETAFMGEKLEGVPTRPPQTASWLA